MFNLQLFKKPFFYVLLFLFLFAVSCGENSVSPAVSTGFEQWKEKLPASVEDFAEYWNGELRESFISDIDWSILRYSDHKDDAAPEIWRSKIINCHRITILLQSLYGGEFLYLSNLQNSGKSHCILLYQRNAIYFCVSLEFGKLKIKELKTGKQESMKIILEDFQCGNILNGYPKSH